MPVLLLVLFSMGLGTILAIVFRVRQRALAPLAGAPPRACPFEKSCGLRRPGCWLAIRSRNLAAVQSALGVHNAKPCSWLEGLARDEQLFIAPPVNGWILVMGSGLPDPGDDVDVCFRFVLELSRKLGQVQLFSASRVLHQHAWVKAERGRVVRAYAWAGKTLWHQGARTSAEKELAVACYDYGEPAESNLSGHPDAAETNVDKVPLLAARWSLDPGRIDQRYLEHERGIAGDLSHRF